MNPTKALIATKKIVFFIVRLPNKWLEIKPLNYTAKQNELAFIIEEPSNKRIPYVLPNINVYLIIMIVL